MILHAVGPAPGALAAPEILHELTRAGYRVEVILEPGTRNFVGPGAFIGSLASSDGRENFSSIIFAPATAGTIARLAHGLTAGKADEAYASGLRPVYVVPDLDPATASHPAVIQNLALLRADGCGVIEGSGGNMASPGEVVAEVLGGFAGPLTGLRVLVTAGGTREPIDSVRFVGNKSSGKMGIAVAREARRLGAKVAVVAANVERVEPGVEWHPVETVDEMSRSVMKLAAGADVLVMAAAVSDFKPASALEAKVRRSEGLSVEFVATEDILAAVRGRNPDLFMVGFAATHGDPVPDAREKLSKKGVNLVVGNDISRAGIGFGAEENEVYVVSRDGARLVPRASKPEVARAILVALVDEMRRERQD